jgi:hypothetical protein
MWSEWKFPVDRGDRPSYPILVEFFLFFSEKAKYIFAKQVHYVTYPKMRIGPSPSKMSRMLRDLCLLIRK